MYGDQQLEPKLKANGRDLSQLCWKISSSSFTGTLSTLPTRFLANSKELCSVHSLGKYLTAWAVSSTASYNASISGPYSAITACRRVVSFAVSANGFLGDETRIICSESFGGKYQCLVTRESGGHASLKSLECFGANSFIRSIVGLRKPWSDGPPDQRTYTGILCSFIRDCVGDMRIVTNAPNKIPEFCQLLLILRVESEFRLRINDDPRLGSSTAEHHR